MTFVGPAACGPSAPTWLTSFVSLHKRRRLCNLLWQAAFSSYSQQFFTTFPSSCLPSTVPLQLSCLPPSVVVPPDWRYRCLAALFPAQLPTSLTDYLGQLCSRLELLADLPHIVFVAAFLCTFHQVPSWRCAKFDFRSPKFQSSCGNCFHTAKTISLLANNRNYSGLHNYRTLRWTRLDKSD